MTFIDLETRAFKQLLPGIRIQTFWGEQQLLSFVSFAAHSTVPAHSHVDEQSGTVLAGEIELAIAGDARRLQPGDSYLIPAHVMHSARSFDAIARVLDVFSPVRADYQY